MNSTSVEQITRTTGNEGRSLWRLVSRFFNLIIGILCVGVNMAALCINDKNVGALLGLGFGMLSIACAPQTRAVLARAFRRMADSLSD